MKRLALIFVLLSCAAQAQVTHVKSAQGFCNTSTFGAGGNITSSCASPALTKTFTFGSTNAGDAILFSLGAGTGGTQTTVTLSCTANCGTGWTLTPLSGVTGSSTAGWIASFGAIAPNTTTATFTITWGADAKNFMNDLIDEFTGNDQTGGTTTFDAHNQATNTTGGCALSVTPANNNDGIWFACNDNVSGTGSYTQGANDTQSDWSEYKILSGGSGTPQASAWTTSGAFGIVGATIKAAASISMNLFGTITLTGTVTVLP